MNSPPNSAGSRIYFSLIRLLRASLTLCENSAYRFVGEILCIGHIEKTKITISENELENKYMKLNRKKKILVFLLALLTAAAVMPVPALAAENVTYLRRSWNSETNTITESYETVTEPLKSFPGECEGGGWFYIGADKTCNDRVTIPARAVVNLILADGVTLDCKNGILSAAAPPPTTSL